MVKGLKEQIIRTVRLEDVVQRYTTLYRGSKSGKTKCCNCMFHADEYASFKVRVFEQTYECEMCKETGNVVQFVKTVEGCTELQALLLLVKWYDIQPENPKIDLNFLADLAEKGPKPFKASDEMGLGFIIDSLSFEDCGDPLFCPEHECLELGMSPEVLPDTYRDLCRCILFPIRNEENVPQGFIKHQVKVKEHRAISYPRHLEEYFLLGLNQAAESIKRNGFVYLVWSTKELLAMFAAGFTNTVACCYKELTSYHLEQLAKHTNQVILIYRDSIAKETLMTKSAIRLKRYSIDSFHFPIYGKLPVMYNYMGKHQFEYFISQSTRMIFMGKERDELIEKLEQMEKDLEMEKDLTKKIKLRSEMITMRKHIEELDEMLS